MNQPYWSEWAHFLHRHHLDGFASVLVDGLGPVRIVLAQIIYAGQVFVHPDARDPWNAAGGLLECDEDSRSFAAFLRGESH